MEAFSILQIPKYQQNKLCVSTFAVGIDYRRYNIRDRKLWASLIVSNFYASDTDNNNTRYDWDVAYLRIKSPRGKAHQVLLPVIGAKPVPFLYVEEYGIGQWLKWSVARIDFYGAFFQFYDDLPQRYKNLYESIKAMAKNTDKKVWCTRIDIAVDCEYEFPQKWHKWIKPCLNSDRQVAMWKHHWLFNSYAYLSSKNSGYGVRIYNKTVEVLKDQKEFWYWGPDKIKEKWTRIEFEFYNPYSSMSEEELIDMVQERILGKKVQLGMRSRPTFTFDIEVAYKYFERYAKNHWLTTDQLIEEILQYNLYIEEKREIYWLTE